MIAVYIPGFGRYQLLLPFGDPCCEPLKFRNRQFFNSLLYFFDLAHTEIISACCA